MERIGRRAHDPDVAATEPLRQLVGERRLARTGPTVDGDEAPSLARAAHDIGHRLEQALPLGCHDRVKVAIETRWHPNSLSPAEPRSEVAKDQAVQVL